jgi:hypothetical protein
MAVKVSDVQEIGDPSGLLYGFTISDDRTPSNMITVTFKTRDEAEEAVDMIRDAIVGAVSVEEPPVR